MKIALFGGSGFIGSHVKRVLRLQDHELTIVLRDKFNETDDDFCANYITGHKVVLNFSGASLLKKWTESYRRELYNSRILTTRKIATAILRASDPPVLFINASAVSIYNDHGKHTENSVEYADTFLSNLCRDWESEANKVSGRCRVVNLRMGLVLAKDGGVLTKMAPFFRLGIGARVGSGTQGLSWIHIDDLLEIILFVMRQEKIDGIVNAVGEYPTDNYNFSDSLGKMFRQPVYFSIPRFAMKMIFGDISQVLINGQKVIPAKLQAHGFTFKYPTIDKALIGIYRD